ncbi:MAG: MerR family redox-sensitive transcriptional activator SoxR [Paraglaciecola sp.]|jgi:MerR family redox-sensitive transcriptional activator SoxR
MLLVGDVAKRADVAISSVHFYEKKGLIFASRNNANQRIYSEVVLRRIAVIKTAQQIGLSLTEIKEAMSVLPINKAPTKKQWELMSSSWQTLLQDKMKKLTQLNEQLTSCIGCGCLSLEKCKLYNPNDEISAQGSGAVFWNK